MSSLAQAMRDPYRQYRQSTVSPDLRREARIRAKRAARTERAIVLQALFEAKTDDDDARAVFVKWTRAWSTEEYRDDLAHDDTGLVPGSLELLYLRLETRAAARVAVLMHGPRDGDAD